jgi:hypothetical protein
MIADNNLEPFGIVDLFEMMEVGSNDRLQIIVQVDRAAGYFATHPDVPLEDWTSAKRFRVERGRLVELADVGEVNMGEASALSGFVEWGIKSYPADRVGLIMWDHGGGWANFGGDESHGEDMLTLAEIRAGLDDAFAKTGTKRLALIGFDACLMATYEVARSLRPYAHYMMASEELEPGIGWEYQALAGLAANPSMSPEVFGREMASAYKNACDQAEQGGDITLSMVNLNALDKLDAALDRVVAQVRSSGALAALLRARSGALSFGKNADPKYDRHLVDIGALMQALVGQASGFEDERDAVMEALRGVVVTEVNGPATQAATGLSIYLPAAATYYDPAYGALGLGGSWPGLIAELAGVSLPSGERPTFTNPDHVAQVAEEQGNIILAGQLAASTAQNVAEVRLYVALVVDEAAGEVVVLSDMQGVVDVGSGAAAGAWNQRLLMLKQGGQQSYGYLSTHIQGDYQVYMIPFGYAVRAGAQPEVAFWTQVYDPAKGEVISSGFYAISEGGTGQLTPAPGSVLYPLALVVQGGQASWSLLSDAPFDATQGIGSELVAVPSGAQIYLELDVKDATGNLDYVTHIKNY